VQKVVRGVAVWNGAVPRRVCGKGGATVAAKIQDCYDQHAGDLPSWNAGVANKIQWNGEAKGNAGQGRWTLVTIYSASLGNGVACDATCFEVWQDERTKLIWSDRLAGANTNWCNASGNTENRDGINCTAGGIGGQSWCTDDALHVAYKGNTLAAENVKWRLPTIYDWKLADVNGIRIVLPNMANWFWSASVFSLTRGLAWFFDGLYGYVDVGPRVSDDSVRCLGVVGP
jgi:hypothetical protein